MIKLENAESRFLAAIYHNTGESGEKKRFKNKAHKQKMHRQAIKEGEKTSRGISDWLNYEGYTTTPHKVAYFLREVPGIKKVFDSRRGFNRHDYFLL